MNSTTQKDLRKAVQALHCDDRYCGNWKNGYEHAKADVLAAISSLPSAEHSKCCHAPLKVSSADEGTQHYVCTKCGEASDPAPSAEEGKDWPKSWNMEVVKKAYSFVPDDNGQLWGLTAGDHGFEETGIIVDMTGWQPVPDASPSSSERAQRAEDEIKAYLGVLHNGPPADGHFASIILRHFSSQPGEGK